MRAARVGEETIASAATITDERSGKTNLAHVIEAVIKDLQHDELRPASRK